MGEMHIPPHVYAQAAADRAAQSALQSNNKLDRLLKVLMENGSITFEQSVWVRSAPQ